MGNRVSSLRKRLGLTQNDLANLLSITRSAIGAIEKGNSNPSLEVIRKLSYHLSVGYDYLIDGKRDVADSITGYDTTANLNANPNANLLHEDAPEYKKNSTSFEESAIITLDTEGNAVIPIVDARATAGLPTLIQDKEYFSELPSMSLPWPMFKLGTWICIQVTGGSMRNAIQSMDYVIAQQVTDNQRLRTGEVYVVVSRDGVVCKRLASKTPSTIKLSSDNAKYGDFDQSLEEVLQIWEVKSIIKMDTESISSGPRIEAITKVLDKVSERLTALEKA